jgi:hypothetical protein
MVAQFVAAPPAPPVPVAPPAPPAPLVEELLVVEELELATVLVLPPAPVAPLPLQPSKASETAAPDEAHRAKRIRYP